MNIPACSVIYVFLLRMYNYTPYCTYVVMYEVHTPVMQKKGYVYIGLYGNNNVPFLEKPVSVYYYNHKQQ